MKLLLLISLVTVCYSFPTYLTRKCSVDIDGTITIQGENGRQITVHRNRQDLNKYDVILSYPYGMFQKHVVLQVNADEMNTFIQLFSKYENLMEEKTYRRLSEEVHMLYRAGAIHPKAYSILQFLDHHLFSEHVDQEILIDNESTRDNKRQEEGEERARTPIDRVKWLQRKVEDYQVHQDESLHRIMQTYLPEHFLDQRSMDSFKQVLNDMLRDLERHESSTLTHENIRYFIKRHFEENRLTHEEFNNLVQALHQLQFEQYPWERQHMQHNHESDRDHSLEHQREPSKEERNHEYSQRQQEHPATRDRQQEYENTYHPGHVNDYRQSAVPRDVDRQFWHDSNRFTDIFGNRRYVDY
ncbi:putative mediator of RNA polymerase II transcription subunit 26 [Diorhabda carinulata]|uniref:putative mediator of RNA polymerase II transcription subunit 26 n=1 Tax=Diorhabda carinulata TaxID=1163345 RepID=UPI0025A04B05|nr:putative mediator of RNA polymerase II transcription subunit 26 [Diorhabda carinulata]